MGKRRDAAWLARNLGRSDAVLFTKQDLEVLAKLVEHVEVDQDVMLFEQGSHPHGVWIVQSGWIAAVSSSGSARDLLALFGPRQCVGDVPVLLDTPAPYRARALTQVSALFVDRRAFHELLRRNGRMALRWASKLAGAIARMQGRVVELLGQTLEEQIARVLLHEGDDDRFAFSQEVCAALIGASRSSVNQVLRRFERQGLVRLSYGLIEVLDRDGIVRVAS